MSDKEVSQRIFSNYDEFIKYLCKYQINTIQLVKSELVDCFGKDSALVCYSAKSKISPDVAQEAILTQIENMLKSGKSVAVIYHISEDYSLLNIAKLMEKVEELRGDFTHSMFSTCINETLFGVDFIFNYD